jgi:sporulation protein YlmC with PRC-barrel domain
MATTFRPRVLSATTMMGDEIKNPDGESLGNLEEIMLDVSSGNVAYAVLSFGGFLGIGDKLFAIPWSSMTIDPDDHAFILDIDREMLENAPGFDKNNWPETMDRDWLIGVYEYYDATPYWE